MSERFVVFIESKDTCNLYDEKTHCFYEIYDSARNVNILCERLNRLVEENEQLKKTEKINMEYAEQIVKENQKLRIAKNDLRIENENLQKQMKSFETTMNATSDYNAYLQAEVKDLEKENEQLKQTIQKIADLDDLTVVDLLNFQDEEIQILKGGINDLLQRIKELNEENEYA